MVTRTLSKEKGQVWSFPSSILVGARLQTQITEWNKMCRHSRSRTAICEPKLLICNFLFEPISRIFLNEIHARTQWRLFSSYNSLIFASFWTHKYCAEKTSRLLYFWTFNKYCNTLETRSINNQDPFSQAFSEFLKLAELMENVKRT